MTWIRNKTIGAKRRVPDWTLIDGATGRVEKMYDKKPRKFAWKSLWYTLTAALAGALSSFIW